MGIDLRHETESGEELEVLYDSRNLVGGFLPDSYWDTSFVCLRFIDPYGDTTFNQLQIPHLAKELEQILASLPAGAVREHCEKVLRMAAEGQTHTYLKFYGD